MLLKNRRMLSRVAFVIALLLLAAQANGASSAIELTPTGRAPVLCCLEWTSGCIN
jgi:hypothetical protein